jgi:tRNA(fMet)-specific endonuclease VapC
LKLVLDTNIYSGLAEGLPVVVEAVAEQGDFILMPAIVIGELIYGFMKGSRREFNERKLRQFISRLKVRIIEVDEDVARKYALIYAALLKKGRKIPINDVWIASCCMQAGGTLLTMDRHFEAIEQIPTIIL